MRRENVFGEKKLKISFVFERKEAKIRIANWNTKEMQTNANGQKSESGTSWSFQIVKANQIELDQHVLQFKILKNKRKKKKKWNW